MKKSRKNKPKYKSSGALHPAAICAIIIVGAILLMFYEYYPPLKKVRDSFISIFIFKLAITAAVIFFTFRNKKELSKTGKILSLFFSAVPWITVITLSNRIYLIYITVLFFAIFGYVVMKYLKELKVCKMLNFEATLLAIFMLTDSRAYSFIDKPRGLHFWVIPLIIGIIAGIISFFLVKADLLDYTKSNLVLMPIVVCFMFFANTWTTAMNMNYALDFSEPAEHTAVIVDKDSDTSGKSINFSFILELDGKTIELDVSHSDYENYEIGNEVIIKLYRGAFNDAFYVKD